MAKKFAHEIAYRGKDLTQKLASKLIVVCGAGALGSNLIDLLCRQGVSNLRVIDFDRVEEHNVNTQLFGEGDIGALKVNALKNRLFKDTGVEINTFDKKLEESNIKKAFKDADLVVDTFDNRASRALIYDFCKRQKIEAIHGGMIDDFSECFWNDKYKVPNDAPAGTVDVCEYPLARNLVMLTVTVLSEEIIDFCTARNPRKSNWTITLKDLSIQRHY